jgi:allantoinase
MTPSDLNVIAPEEDGSRPAGPGYDHGWWHWSPLPARAAVRWPGGAELAVSIVLDLGAVEWEAEGRGTVPPPGGRGIGAYPDFPRMSHREFGHRVGVFRLLDMLSAHGVPVTAAVDVLTVEHYGALVDRLRPVVREWMAAGISASRPLTSSMSADEERHYIATTLERLENGLGVRPAGWLSPERSESSRTPGLLGEAGLEYVADLCNDELPYPMTERAQGLWAFPLSWELSDVNTMFLRLTSPQAYAESVRQAVEVMCEDGRHRSPRALGLPLSPWLAGQAFRAAALESVLEWLADDERVWLATPQEILDHVRNAQ